MKMLVQITTIFMTDCLLEANWKQMYCKCYFFSQYVLLILPTKLLILFICSPERSQEIGPELKVNIKQTL